MAEKTLYELSNEMVVKTAKEMKVNLMPNLINTGITYFLTAKERLCKIRLTKKNLQLECNIQLSKELLEKLADQKGIEIEEITPEIAKKKKYGTMKHLITAIDNSWTQEIIKDMLKTYKK